MRRFFSNGGGAAAPSPLRKNLNALFDRYRDDAANEPDQIGPTGSQNLLATDLQLDLEDVSPLIFFELVQSPSFGTITREGFVDGWSAVNIDSLPQMRNLILQRRSALPHDRNLFKNVYNHTFNLALAPGAKTLPLDEALVFWGMLLTDPGWRWKTARTPWLDWWLEFQQEKKTKAVNRDLWKQTFNFAEASVKDDTLGFWSEESSWPSVIDEFVQWVKTDKRPDGVNEMQVD